MVLRDFQEKQETEKLLFSYPVILALILLILALIVGIFKIFGNYVLLGRDIGGINDQIANLKREKTAAQAKIDQLKTPIGLEKEARERFNLKKPGEDVAIFVDDASQPGNKGLLQRSAASLFGAIKRILTLSF